MKACPDCGANNEATAVTCVECGSLFADQVGVDVGKRKPVDPPPMLTIPGEPAATTETRGSTVLVCRACGAVNSPTHVRCTVCGSDQLAAKSASSVTVTKGGRRKRLSAWDRRPRKGIVDGEFPDVSAALIFTFFGIGVLKLLLCTALGIQIVMGQAGPKGLHPDTFAWKWALGPTLLVDAFVAAVGAIGLFYLRKYGAAMMSISLLLDVLLMAWLVAFNTWGTLNLWPGSGPYFFLGCVCFVCSIELMHKAFKGDML
jgi:ribosomal protein L40E